MTARSQESALKAKAYKQGQRLYCQSCGLEIEIISPCTCTPMPHGPRCCGRDMSPEVGVPVNLDD